MKTTQSLTPAAWLLASVAVAGCGAVDAASGEIAFPPEPLARLTTEVGRWRVAVRTSPQPPIKGLDAVQLQITDADGAAVDGLVVTAVPWMPAHGHGTSARTQVAAQGMGVYQVANVYLYMDGQWELRSTLVSDVVTDSVTPVFDVP